MADDGKWQGATWKQEEDHSAEADALLARVNATTVAVILRAEGKTLDEVLVEVLALEKVSRLSGDTLSTQRLATEVIRICRVVGDYPMMLSQLESLMRKRAQMKQVQSALVAEAALTLQAEGLSKAQHLEILTHLQHITEGKIHVELEHARFTTQLAEIAVAEGRKKEASDMLQAIQVETLTNMTRLEKIKILVREISLALDIKDYTRAQIMARKINYRALGRDDTKEQKVEYFKLMAQYYAESDRAPSYMHMARCWLEIARTVATQDLRLQAMSSTCALVMLAPHMTEQQIENLAECTAFCPETYYKDRLEWMKALVADQQVCEELAPVRDLMAAFISVELICTKTVKQVDEIATRHPILADNVARQAELRHRVSEHDVLVVAQYYRCIHVARLAELTGLTPEATEEYLMSMVTARALYARIDRIDGVVRFQKKKSALDVATQWDQGVQKIVELIGKSCQLVAKERMVRGPAATATAAPPTES